MKHRKPFVEVRGVILREEKRYKEAIKDIKNIKSI